MIPTSFSDWVDTDPAEESAMKDMKTNLGYLASDELKGRLTGSEGEKKAAAYIEKKLKSYGLKPQKQPFEYPIKLNPHEESSSVKMSGNQCLCFLGQ